MIKLSYFLIVSTTSFLLGLFGIMLNRISILLNLLCVELILLSVNINFVVFSVYLDDIGGQIFTLFVLAVAAAESAIGLALLVVYFRVHNTLSIYSINLLQG